MEHTVNSCLLTCARTRAASPARRGSPGAPLAAVPGMARYSPSADLSAPLAAGDRTRSPFPLTPGAVLRSPRDDACKSDGGALKTDI